jgi:Na+-transporting methylmalonyl-CoA/oxaloacetate decarboxylase gamma subunit
MEITNALWITLIGMGLVFVAILALWGLMALLVKVLKDREPAEGAAENESEPIPESGAISEDAALIDRKRRAAAAAAAVALAMNQSGSKPSVLAREPRPGGSVSPWLAAHRAGNLQPSPRASRKKVN